jgi:hypothetical protein
VPCPQHYTKFMGDVDLSDQYLQYYIFGRKSSQWPMKVYWDCMEMAKFNAFRLWQAHHPQRRPVTFLKFTLKVIKGLIGNFANPAWKGATRKQPMDTQLTSRCMPVAMNRSRCRVCYDTYKRLPQEERPKSYPVSSYGCATCGQHLCLPFYTVPHTEALRPP